MVSSIMTVDKIKKEGIKHEQELVKKFKDNGFVACRLPSSSARSPDVLAGDGESIFVIEVKTTHNSMIKVRKQQVYTLRSFAFNLNAKPFLALKFLNRSSWLFVDPRFLKNNEKVCSIDYNTAALNGFSFQELLSNELQMRLI